MASTAAYFVRWDLEPFYLLLTAVVLTAHLLNSSQSKAAAMRRKLVMA